MFMYRPLVHPWGGVSYILIIAADIRTESWSYTPYVQFFGSPVLVPLQLHNNKLSFQAVHQFAHQNPIYTRWKPSATEVQCSLCLEFTQWLGWWNACWASVTTSQTWNNKNTSTSGDSKWIQNKVRIYRLISFFFFFFFSLCISSQWIGHMMIHAVHRWGTFTQRMTRDIWSTTTHTIRNKPLGLRFRNSSKDMKSMERHIQLIINVPCVICLSVCLVISHEVKCENKPDLRTWFYLWMLKYIYNLNIGTNSLLSLIYTLE